MGDERSARQPQQRVRRRDVRIAGMKNGNCIGGLFAGLIGNPAHEPYLVGPRGAARKQIPPPPPSVRNRQRRSPHVQDVDEKA